MRADQRERAVLVAQRHAQCRRNIVDRTEERVEQEIVGVRSKLDDNPAPPAPAEAGDDVAQHPVIEPGFDPANNLVDRVAGVSREFGRAGPEFLDVERAVFLMRGVKAPLEPGDVVTRLGIALDEQTWARFLHRRSCWVALRQAASFAQQRSGCNPERSAGRSFQTKRRHRCSAGCNSSGANLARSRTASGIGAAT